MNKLSSYYKHNNENIPSNLVYIRTRIKHFGQLSELHLLKTESNIKIKVIEKLLTFKYQQIFLSRL